MFTVFICPKDVLQYKFSITFFLRLAWKNFFVGFSDLLDYEMTNGKNVCESVSLYQK